MVEARSGPSRLPLDASTLALEMAERTSASVRPALARALGLTWMRTAGFSPPESVTRPTPEICEIFWASLVSARSSSFVMGMVRLVTASVMMGGSAGLTLL